MPGTSSTPTSAAVTAASSHPSALSWSVRATTSRPADAAARTRSAGRSVPSGRGEWVWRSIRTVRPAGSAALEDGRPPLAGRADALLQVLGGEGDRLGQGLPADAAVEVGVTAVAQGDLGQAA